MVRDGETALLSGVNETEKFSTDLLLLVEDDEMRKRLGENSHEHVIERFGYQRLVSDMSQLYYELLDRKRRE